MKRIFWKARELQNYLRWRLHLNQAFHDHFLEEELASFFSIRGYKLTPKGERILEQYQDIVDRHPKKNL